MHRRQPFHPLQQIGHMPQHVFNILGCLVGHIRKEAKGCNIDKYIRVKGTDITGKIPSLYGNFRCPHHVFGQRKTAAEVVGASRRDIANRSTESTGYYSRHCFVQGSVSATAHHQLIIFGTIFHNPLCISLFPGWSHGNFILCLGKHVQDIGKFGSYLSLSCFGIIYEKKLFRHIIPPLR